MSGPLQAWERACLRIVMWGGILQGAVVASTVLVAIAKAVMS